jgi:transaldolase
MTKALDVTGQAGNIELIWASPREVLNIVQADAIGCDIITVTHDLLKKLPTLGRDLTEFSLETVRMFHSDGEAAAYSV